MSDTNLLGTSALDLVRSMPGRTASELAALAGVDPVLLADELCTLLWETKVVSGPERLCRVAREDRPVWYAMDEVLGEA